MTRRRIATLLAALFLIAMTLPLTVSAAVPVANDDSDTIFEDSGADVIDVLGNDTSDVPNLIVSAVTQPAGGTASFTDTNVTYTPDPNFHGNDTFTYTDTNDDGDSSPATVTVHVTSVDDAPVANDDSDSTNEGQAVDIDVLANDTDIDTPHGSLTINPGSVSNPPHGSASVVAGKIRYTPDLNYSGTDSFTYRADDGPLLSSPATVDVTIAAVDDAPVANDDTDTTAEDTADNIDVLANDTDVDDAHSSLTISSLSNPPHGTATISGNQVHYVPDANYHGADSFTYKANDGTLLSNTATVDITVTSVNDFPTAVDDFVTIDEDDTPTLISVRSNDTDADGDTLSVTGVTQGGKGAVSFTSTGVTYVPTHDANGSDTFTYTISDGHGGTDVGTVHVTIDPVNDAPIAFADAVTTPEDTATDIDVLANDTDVDNDSLTITDPGTPSHGTSSVVSGKIRYTPGLDYDGGDTLTYTVSDGHGGSDTAVVTITVSAVDDAPVAVDDAYTVPEDRTTPQPLNVLLDDSDVDGPAINIVSTSVPTKGTVVIVHGSGLTPDSLTYKPFHNAFGADAFTYLITDGTLTATGNVTIDIGGSNDPPIAGNDVFNVPEGAGPTPLTVLANDSDPDGNDLQIISKTNPSHGTVTITGAGTGIAYNPSGNYHGTDTFTYKLSDGNGGTDTATVLVTVVKDTTKPTVTTPYQQFLVQTVASTTTKARITWTGADGGSGLSKYQLQVSVNGGTFTTVTLTHATSTTYDKNLTTGKTYRFRVRATDKEGNTSGYLYTGTFKAVRYSEATSAITYIGSWSVTTTSRAFNGATRHATAPSNRAIYTFTSTDVGWIATRYTSSGKAEILIDGVLITTIDLDTTSTKYRQLVYHKHFSTSGLHTIEIHPVGDGRVDIDGFVVLH
jgi:large repetitive protein